MALLDFDGSTKYVWNPYSLEELKRRLSTPSGSFDSYLDCVASRNDGSCTAPTDRVFEQQQIPMLSVYQRCLSNYQENTWDQGAFVMFNRTLQGILRLNTVMPSTGISDTFGVADCLLEQRALGNDNVGCLTDYFLKGTQASVYFAYSNITSTDSPGSDLTDACLTFSGPAKSQNPAVSKPFKACLENSANRTGCDIPHMLWSGRSTNKVAVATQHTLNISDPVKRRQLAQGTMDEIQARVLSVLDRLDNYTGDGLKITIFSSEGDLLHQYADCVMQGPMGSMTLTPGPSMVEKVIWSRNSSGDPSRQFELPCTGGRLANRDGNRDNVPPFTCGTYARRAVIKHFLRRSYDGGMTDNDAAKEAVVAKVRQLINATREAWSFQGNLLCTCPNGSATGWECCMQQTNCATEPCPCPDGYEVPASVACCESVCSGLGGSGLKAPFSYLDGASLAKDLLAGMGKYMQDDIWTSNDPWLVYDPRGAEAYKESWMRARFKVTDAGLFDASKPVVYYDEAKYPFQSTFWEFCTGLLQQVIWTMPIDRTTGKPKGLPNPFDPINGRSQTLNLTYVEDFIRILTTEAYKSSPVYWHYNVRHTPSQSEMCKRTAPRPPDTASSFPIAGQAAAQLGFSAMTLGGLGGADCYCGWWNGTACRIPDALCASLELIVGFTRICKTQRQMYNASDHRTVLAAIEALLKLQPSTVYPCPALRISEHWGFIDNATGRAYLNATSMVLHEGVSGFRVGNVDWLFAAQAQLINPRTRVDQAETPDLSVALDCNRTARSPSIADHFIDDLFPSAQGVRQSMPQSYCVRYGIELARLTTYQAAGLKNAASQQQGTVDKWRVRCQYKLEELAVCNSFKVYNAAGGPTSTARCPFALSVVAALRGSYAVTPGCLLLLWNTPNRQQDGIYDPCICVSCASTPNIDVPAQLTSICRLESFQLLVANDVVPGETSAGVPLGSGLFQSLLAKPGLLQINSPPLQSGGSLPDITHWALQTAIMDADKVLDWWPDAWRHPVGYHVTPGCSRPKDAHWKTFDASWRWDSQTEQMVYARDETNDPLLSRNAFGASGVCRANNYGMPLMTLNSMAVCTKENANAYADPMVPKSSSSAQAWADGAVNCAPDAASTPWAVDRTVNPPRQWTVGTLQREAALAPLPATEWGPGCGPYPLQTCASSSDCAAGLACVLVGTATKGVCGYMQPGKFECASHAQCGGDLMCAGDGLCVQGVWQVRNDVQDPVSFRSYSQECATGNPLDTWGTSIAEKLPDILNASGLCSYRSWFENRRMASRNQCNTSAACLGVSGSWPWNFTAPDRRADEARSAFESGVLKLQPHPCDRDYQHYRGFSSCTPNDNYATVFDDNGKPLAGPYARDNRTITYRADGMRLPLIHHMDGAKGPSFGFTGIPMTYRDLKLGTSSPSIVPCASQKVCSLQQVFKVNNVEVDHRLVLDGNSQRGYTVGDLLKCGVFGFMVTSAATTTCQLDYAVAPLASFLKDNAEALISIPSSIRNLPARYTPDQSGAVLSALQQLPDALLQYHIGGPPTTFQDYVSKAGLFVALHQTLDQIKKPTYPDGRVPRQLYNLTMYGAYEVPFAWWFRCGWLANNAMTGTIPINSCQVQNPDGGNASQPTGFMGADPRLSTLFGEAPVGKDSVRNTTLLQQLISLPGIITQGMLDRATADYAAARNAWIRRLAGKMQTAQKKCYTMKRYNMNFSALSQRYQLDMIKQANGAFLFDARQPYVDDSTNATLCSGLDCLISDGYSIPTKSNSNFSGIVMSKLAEAGVSTSTVPLRNRIVPVITGVVVLDSLFFSAPVDPVFWSDLSAAFENLPLNCNQPSTRQSSPDDAACLCERWESCSPQVQSMMLQRAKIASQPQNTLAANVVLNATEIDVCSQGLLNTDGCFLNTGQLGDAPVDFRNVTSISLPIGVNAELYMEKPWTCVALTCSGPLSNLNMVPVPQGQKPPGTVTMRERVIVDEYRFDQRVGMNKLNPWKDMATQNSEIQCGQNFYRFQWTNQGRNLACVQTCSVQMRSVLDFVQMRMVARNISYYVNEQLVAQFETYPCFESNSGKYANLETGDVAPFADDRIPALVMQLRSNGAYRPSAANAIIGVCDTDVYSDANGLPRPGSFNFIRSNLMDPGNLDVRSFGRIQHIVGTINADHDETTMQIRPLTSQERQAKCSVLKGDPFLGCIMWPGERMQPGGGPQFHCQPPKYVKYYQPMFTQCMQDSATDTCTSIDQIVTRRMALDGRSILYNFTTTTPLCTAGDPKQCSLADEISNWQNGMYACPGTNASLDRYKGYIRVQASGRTHTDILLYQSLSWKTDPSTAGLQGFDHLFLGLSPGFQCGSQAPTTCGVNYTPVEMRRRLWLCVECPMITSTQCTGTHDCRIVSPGIAQTQLDALPGWDRLTRAQRAFLTQSDSTIDVAIPAVQWLAQQVLGLWTSGVALSYEVPDFMRSFSGSYTYNPASILAFDAAMRVNAKTCTLTAQLPDFTNCSYDGRRRDLKEFVAANYKVPDGLIIRPGHTLQWQVGRAQMTSQNIPQWESTAGRTGLFLDDLFSDKWCMKGNMVDNACFITVNASNAPVIRVLNPGLLGAFEPSVGCDTAVVNQQRVTYSFCRDCGGQEEYLQLESEGGAAYYMQCPSTYQAVQQVTVDETAASNLCSKTPYSFEGLPSKCGNRHGTLGAATATAAFEGSPSSTLYASVPWTGGQPTGMGQNPLLRGAAPLAGVPPSLSLSSSDIGGHFVRMVLGTTRDGASVLSVQGLPLSSYASATSPAAYGLGVLSSSPRWAQIDAAAETFRLASKYPNSVCAAWDCPLRRRAFYMGMDAKFRPSVPDPLRTRVLYGTRAHPTQAAYAMPTTIDRTSSRVLGVYNTSNGFCACMTASCAAACASDAQALYGTWTSSSVLPAASPCVEQLDWPYAGGTLRDGAPFDQRWTTVTPCGILDRLPSFQYMYTNRKAAQPSSSGTTLDKGGVCHMGWPAVTAGPLAGCYLLVETDTYMCPWFLSPKNVTRLRAKTVDELLNSPTRPQLGDCSAPPGYRINGTVPTAPEVSYGQLKRWEASRLLASDLRRQLCGNSTVCEPSSQWTLPTFWSKVYMANFPPIPGGNGADDALWSKPWVMCVQTAANGSQTCDGTIPRSSWATGNRPQLCLDAVQRSPLSKNLSQNVNVCDLDSTLDLFCRTIQDARYGVFEANCLYSGQCSPKLFFYQPSTYAVDNGEFVRQTVQRFYNGTVEGACIPDQDTAAAIAANAQDLANCPAMQLNVLIDCIQIVRVIVGSLVELVYYCGQLMLKVFQLLGANDQEKQSIITEINAMLALIKNKFIVLFQEIGDLFYKILFDGPMGSWLITMIQAVCNFLEWLFSDVVYLVLCWVQTVSVWFLQNIATGFINVLNGISFGRLGYLQDGISRAVTSIQENIPCTPQKLWSCNLPFSNDDEAKAILPMPTRCWAGAQPEIGGSLACSAADTCIQQSDFTHVICGACPAASSMIKFGCDSLTKLCTCNVFPVGVSSCVTHQECTLDESTVDCQYVDSYLMPSYGNVPCNRCPKPICLITDGSGVGRCSCLLKPVPSQTCTGVGQRVSPDAQDLCLVSSASSGLGGNNMYSVTYRTLASVPCMLLNQAQTYCMTVITSGTVSTQLVVGLALLSTRRRRLLTWENNESNATELLGMTAFRANVTHDIWGGRGEPCRSLVLAEASRLGILELYARSECWRWYEIGVRLTIEANMTEVSPFLLVTWRDLADAMLERRSLVEIMAKLPSLIHRLLLHSELSQPAYLLVMYWSGMVPKNVWTNQTMLDETKAFFFNATAAGWTGRRLLEHEEEEDQRPTQRRRLSQSSVINTEVSSQTAYEWSQGPYSWPPNFVYWKGDQSCALVSTAIEVVKNGLDSTILYYQRETPEPVPVSWPSLPLKKDAFSLASTPSVPAAGIDLSSPEAAAASAKDLLSNLTDVWLDRDRVAAFVREAPYMSTLKRIVQCNFTRIQTCEDRHPLFWSAVQTGLVVLLLGMAARLLEIPYVDVALAACFVPLFLYVTYGYSPTCVPMIPTCLLSDLFELISWLLPPSVQWPDPLTTGPNCEAVSCLKSCTNDPVVGYASFNAHLAWIMCEMDPAWALDTALTFTPGDPVRMAILTKCADHTSQMRSAQRICFAATIVNSFPILLLGLVALWIIPIALSMAAAAAQSAATLAFTFIIYVHSHEE